MTDNLTSQLQQASFKGATFRVRTESMPEEGRKIVLHEYANSSERFVEDLGQLPSKFTIDAFVHGADWGSKTDALRAALNSAGVGELVLPFFGAVQAYALPYAVDTSHSEIGEAKFTLSFALGRPSAGPSLSARDIEEVYDLGDTARSAIESALGGAIVPPSTVANASAAQYDTISSLRSAQSSLSTLMPTSTLEHTSSILALATATAPTLVRSGSSLASALIGVSSGGLWQEISLGFSSLLRNGGAISGAFNSLMSLSLFGGGLSTSIDTINRGYPQTVPTGEAIPLWTPNTAQRIDRNTNREAIVYSTRVAALVTAYEVAAASDYSTLDDINNTRSQLEDANERLMRVDTSDQYIIQSDETVRASVLGVRLAALDVLEQKRQETFQTLTISQNTPVSSLVLAHSLYAEEFTNTSALETRAIDVRNLNPADKSTAMVGDLVVFRG